jgi:hypothetical protein
MTSTRERATISHLLGICPFVLQCAQPQAPPQQAPPMPLVAIAAAAAPASPLLLMTLLATSESTRWGEVAWQLGQVTGASACAAGRMVSKVSLHSAQKYS